METLEKKAEKKKVKRNDLIMVETSEDYDMFQPLNGNRIVDESTVRRLVKSFEKRYLFSPILVNEEYKIIDGQHRFEAARELKLPINYIVVKGYGLHEVQILNSNTKNWTKLDYLESYCELNKPAYLLMRDFMKDFPEFGIRSIETLLTFNYWGVNYNTKAKKDRKNAKEKGTFNVRVRKFEEGLLEIPDEQKSYKFANQLLEYREFFPGYHRHSFVSTMVSLFDDERFSHEEFIEKLKMQPTSLVNCVSIQQYRALIELLYNFKRHHKINLRF